MKSERKGALVANLGLIDYGYGSYDHNYYGDRLCGVVDNYPLTLLFYRTLGNSGNLNLQLFVDRKADRETKRQLSSALRSQGGKLRAWNGEIITIVVPEEKKLSGTAEDYIHFALHTLRSLGVKPNEFCPICGSANCDCAALTPKGYRLSHRRCLQQKVSEKQEKAEHNAANGNYLLGAVGALLGAIVGTLPTMLTIVLMERYYAVLFALIPICAYYGYKLFGGKLNKSALVISIVMSLLGLFALNYEYMIYLCMDQFGIGFGEAFALTAYFLTDGTFFATISEDLITQVLFTALGVFLSWKIISGTAGEAVSTASTQLETAVPYPTDVETEE